jgi:multicomponent Na+:H+ antiporter subunit A
MELFFIVLSGFVLAIFAPAIHRLARGAAGWILALLPLAIAADLARRIGAVEAGEVFTHQLPWIPSLGVQLSFRLDGLSLLFALLISGIGALILIYAGGYLAGHPLQGRIYCYLLLFMGSMLGVVLADNVITLFVFWELTSLTSYLLIGFDHDREKARWAALQALLVTGAGGLVLLAGLILLGQVGGSLELSELLERGGVVRSHSLYLPILLLVLGGAFTKSAQFPFHFWLPNAMEAPTPVSAYLHAATMVKAGIYLLARLSPVLGGTEVWHYTVAGAGATTMLLGAVMAISQTEYKRVLAYSTVSALGTLTLLLGLDTVLSTQAAVVFLLVHAMYKGALFLIAGEVDHETGERDLTRLGGLQAAMPITAAAALLAALSMAGLPPLLGFISKELLYEAKLQAPQAAALVTGAGVLANILMVALAGIVGLQPFFGRRQETPKFPHEAPVALWLGPAVLAMLGLFTGLFPGYFAEPLVLAAIGAMHPEPSVVKLALWHGLNPVLALSVATVAAGVGVFFARKRLRQAMAALDAAIPFGPARGYDQTLAGMLGLAGLQTRLLQSGYLRYYLLLIIGATIGLAGGAFFLRSELIGAGKISDVRFYEGALALLILLGAYAAVRSQSRLGAVAALGVVGYGVALFYVLYGAPDLAMTQFLVETLLVVLFVLVLHHLPRFAALSPQPARVRDVIFSVAAGALMTLMVLAAQTAEHTRHLSRYFAESSLPLAHGRNVVNVILVDFRGLDTMGEITVLGVAGVGVYALLKLRAREGRGEGKRESEEGSQI